MKRFCILLSILAILNMGVSIADAQWMPDTNLRNGVRRALGFVSGDVLTKRKILDLTEFNAANLDISDLSGLEFATNLVELDLNGNSISDLSALSGLENLTHLYLRNNDITDVEPLRDLTQLELLWVANNSVSDVEPLRDLTQLEVLWLTNNSVSDISALAGLVNLRDLRFRNNSVSDVSALEGLVNLRALRFPNNSVSDVAPLSGLENLRVLQLAGNRITNTGPLAGLVSNLKSPIDTVVFPDGNLEVLVRQILKNDEGLAEDEMVTPELMAQLTRVSISRYDGIIRSLGGLEHATNLEALIFTNAHTARRDLTPLAGLAHLRHVALDGRNIALETLLTLPSLTTLSLWEDADLTDTTIVSQLTSLERLDFAFNRNLRDLTGLENLENLTRLTIVGSYSASDYEAENLTAANALSDISPLSGLENLEYLSLDYNGISDVSPLSALANLERLYLRHNNVSDVSPLVGLTGLTTLRLFGNPVENPYALYPLTQQDPPVDIDIDVSLPVVEVPDAALASLLRTTLELAADADITVAGMEELTTLDASSQGITDLTGLESAVNLESLFLDSNSIVDISPLASLTTLRFLSFENNDISDVSPLRGLVNLEGLHLDDNNVSDLTPFAGLVKLTGLFLRNNDVSDVSPLVDLVNIDFLSLENNSIVDVSPLANLVGLVKLYVIGNSIANAGVLYPLTQQDPPVIIDIDVPVPVVEVPDAALASLLRTTLKLAADADITVADMLDITSLHNLGIAGFITDLTGLEYATNLTLLIISHSGNSQLTDLTPLSGLVNLETLNLQGNVRISDISALSGLIELKDLRLFSNDISDVSPLRDLVNLERLYLSENNISDVSPLAGLVKLEWLGLSSNDISDVSPLSGLVNLERLFLANNSIVDVSPLANLVGLERLFILGNPITDTSPLEYISAVLDIEVDRSVNMPDAVLAAKVRETLGLEADTPITKPDLQNLTELRYELYDELLDDLPNYLQLDSARAISDLTGLEHARNLTHLMCQGSTGEGVPGITDITPLTGLVQLEELFLEANTISDFTPLAGLTNLRTLALDRNHISDISGLSGLTSLGILSLNANDISDVSPLENLTNLRDLYLLYNNIRDIKPLKPLLDDLTYLVLGLNPLMDTRILLPSTFRGSLDITPSEYPSWDVNEDGSIDRLDVRLVTAALGQVTEQLAIDRNNIVYGTPLAEDVNHDGIVDNADVEIVQSHIVSNTARPDTLTINLSGAPTVEIDLAFPGKKTGPFDIIITFSEAVTGFQQSEVVFTSKVETAEITAWNTDDNITYTATVTPTISEDVGRLIIRVPPGVAINAEDNRNAPSIPASVKIYGGDIVEFTDANLAAAIRDTLNVAANQNITTGLLTILVKLDANNLQISDLTGLGHATSLERLYLQNNSISELSPLGNLTSLSALRLDFNDIVNISNLGNLTSLTLASFTGNEIVDISSLEAWSMIGALDLRRNNITDVSPLEDLTSLTSLMLKENPILDTRPLYPLTLQDPPVDIDIAVSQYAPWDVNEDGNVDATDTALVTAAIGQSGADIVDSRTDVNGDDTVDAGDLLLVTGNLNGANGAAPTTLGGIVNLVDATTLESLDRDVLQAQLHILRTESDGSAKYRNAIALLEAFLAATRPEETVLLANYPNPFNPETWLPYHLADASNVRITIYDTRGVVVRRLDLGHQREGYYTSRSRAAYWDGRNHVGERVASGVYFYQLEADDVSRLRKMVILK